MEKWFVVAIVFNRYLMKTYQIMLQKFMLIGYPVVGNLPCLAIGVEHKA